MTDAGPRFQEYASVYSIFPKMISRPMNHPELSWSLKNQQFVSHSQLASRTLQSCYKKKNCPMYNIHILGQWWHKKGQLLSCLPCPCCARNPLPLLLSLSWTTALIRMVIKQTSPEPFLGPGGYSTLLWQLFRLRKGDNILKRVQALQSSTIKWLCSIWPSTLGLGRSLFWQATQ